MSQLIFLQNTKNLVILRCCFAEDGKEMHQDSKRTRTAIVLFIKPFVWCRSRHRRRRSLLKGNLRIDDFRTTAPLGHLKVPRRRPVEI